MYRRQRRFVPLVDVLLFEVCIVGHRVGFVVVLRFGCDDGLLLRDDRVGLIGLV